MKNVKIILGVITLLAALASCGTTGKSDSSPSISTGVSTSEPDDVDYIFKADSTDYKVQHKELRVASGSKADLPNLGDRKLLVIPVEFKDYTCAKLTDRGGCDGVRNDIQRSFFGTEEDTAWQSVSTFYKKSSYNNVRLTGEVTPWFQSGYTVAALAQKEGDIPNPSWLVLRDAVAWYKAQPGNDITQYDTDGDGYVDSVWLVYSAPYQLKSAGIPANSNLYWAFVYWDYSQVPNLASPNPYSYAWASYNFMYDDKAPDEHGVYGPITDDNGNVLPDSHTWIHETGHLFGLNDYYTYDDDGDYAAAAALDMMDNNIGDHNAYSKSLLGWTEPTVVTGPGTVTLQPFESSGDCILVKKHWGEIEDEDNEGLYLKDKGSILDEYLMLEFYTPTGLNKWDSEHKYAQNYPQLFTEVGVKVYHIDSRIGGFRYNNLMSKWVFRDYTDVIGTKYEHYDIGNSNTRSRSANPEFKQIHLLESSGNNSFVSQGRSATATNATLFQLNDSFGYETFSGFKFNSGLDLGLKFKITAMSSTSTTIEFVRA